MSEPQYPFACNCGRKFLLRERHLGISVLCPDCSARFTVPADLKPLKPAPATAPGHAGMPGHSNASSRQSPRMGAPASAKKGIDLNYVVPGLLMTVAGIAGGVFMYFAIAGGAAGRGVIVGPAVSLVGIVIGIGMTLKGLLGDRIEWD